MRGRSLKFFSIAIAATLSLSLSSTIEAKALSNFKEIDSTKWGYTYAGSANSSTTQTRPKVANLDAKSKFIVNYKNFPDWAKKDFQAAVDVWAANFASSVPITIDATWARSASYGVLGSARPGNYFAGFDGAPDNSLWYPSALANALSGKDLDTNNAEMVIQVNSAGAWDTRNDGSPRSNEYDLESVFIHEMGHGLGFLSTDSYDPFFGYGTIEQPTPFDAYAQVEDGRRLSDLPTPSVELGKALTSPLIWSGTFGKAANGGVAPKLYTPSRYEDGSSVSHLDENTFSKSGPDSVMTPNLDAGEIFHQPGPLLLAMMEDLRRKPPAGLPFGIPQVVRNPLAIISDAQVSVTFDPPANARAAQISSYTVRNLKTNQVKSSTESPVTFTGLKNGTSYSFSIIASNSNGSSDSVTTTSVMPQAQWQSTPIDATSDAKQIVSTTFNGQPALIYTDSKKGVLKLASWDGKKWNKFTVDGAGGTAGKTKNAISGALSACVNGSGKTQLLHIFYGDAVDHDLHYAIFDGKNFKYDIVDGNGAAVNDYKDAVRVRTASDVSVTSACVATTGGVQVYYRDESQGILLGATKAKTATAWSYELVDGDRKTDGRTTGDVAFHLKSAYDGANTYIIYDSILTINQKKEATSGEVRIATRPTLSGLDWSYSNLDSSGSSVPMVGYDVAIAKTLKGVLASWLVATPETLPKASKIRFSYIENGSSTNTLTPDSYGAPTAQLSTDGSAIAFNCATRLCVLDTTKQKFALASKEQNPDGISSTWVTVNHIRYLAAGISGKLTLLR